MKTKFLNCFFFKCIYKLFCVFYVCIYLGRLSLRSDRFWVCGVWVWIDGVGGIGVRGVEGDVCKDIRIFMVKNN